MADLKVAYLKVGYTWNFFDGIISTGSLDHKTKGCHFVPLGHFPEMGQIHNGGSRFGLPQAKISILSNVVILYIVGLQILC